MHALRGLDLRRVVPWMVLAAVFGIALLGMVPPTVVGAGADAVEFSAERAFAHVVAIAQEPRPIGSVASADARDYLSAQLTNLGLTPELQALEVQDYYTGSGRVPVVNVIARIAGIDPTGSIVLAAHYDTFPGAPGANDDGTAVATLLEVGRALRSGPPLRNDVILLFTDGEEPAPRYGSTAFIDRHPYASGVRLIINLEAIGGSGVSQITELVGNESALMSQFATAVPHPAATSVLDDIVELIGGSNTDIAPFRDRGIAGFEFAYLHGSPIYHTPGDDIGSVHRGSLQHHGTNALSLVRRFGDIDLAGFADDSSEVYFTLVGKVVVHYPAWLGLVLIAVAGMLLAVSVWMEAPGRRPRLRTLAAGTGWLLLLVLGVGIVMGLGWKLINSMLWGTAGPGGPAAFLWLVGMLIVAAVPTASIRRRLAIRLGVRAMEWATLALWWLLGLAAALGVPGAGYLFVWPVLAALLVAAFRPTRRWLALALVALPTVVLILPVVDTFFQIGLPRPGNPDSLLPEIALLVGLLVSMSTALLWPYAAAERHAAGG